MPDFLLGVLQHMTFIYYPIESLTCLKFQHIVIFSLNITRKRGAKTLSMQYVIKIVLTSCLPFLMTANAKVEENLSFWKFLCIFFKIFDCTSLHGW